MHETTTNSSKNVGTPIVSGSGCVSTTLATSQDTAVSQSDLRMIVDHNGLCNYIGVRARSGVERSIRDHEHCDYVIITSTFVAQLKHDL